MFTADSPVDEDGNSAFQQALELAAGGNASASANESRSESRLAAHSRIPSIDLEPDADSREDKLDAAAGAPLPMSGPPTPTATGLPSFEPLGEGDVYDVFDLELTLGAGGKEAGIDARYRSSDISSTSSGRPTYKIQKKTKAHFLGKKNMTVDVSRSLAWDSTTATAANNGSKGYANVFSAKDQSSRSIALHATNSVLSKTAIGAVLDVSSICGAYDPSRAAPGPRRETSAAGHHFFTLKLNSSCMPDKPAHAHGTTRKRGVPAQPAAQAGPKPYTGGGHFVLDGAPHGRRDLLTTLYCTGYEQRPHARPGDIVVAELRLRPLPASISTTDPGAAPPPRPNAWVRFFKERHAALHVARRGLDACMTGPHVHMQVPAADAAGRRAVLARGQALEVVLAALGTALLAVEHDGLESKRWAWLVQRNGAPMALASPAPLAMASLASLPATADNPGLASPDGEGDGTDGHSTDDSQQSPSPGPMGFEPHNRTPGGAGLFAPKSYTASIAEQQNFNFTNAFGG
ncbi:hypothetical protein MVEN_01663200 [Mycena venus]|uniref:Uncharacterized protein n=1 Tax=Mycena venus TaxID=2733690 RepID=A0A8H6XR84_9AGAR|nr:hypothetical protein MVEN_01663200 [Mycena venus]